MKQEEIEKRFAYHPPHGNQAERYEYIRSWSKWLALHICHLTPESREQSLAITALEECVMWANAAIARNEESTPDPNTLYPDVLTTEHQAEPSTPASSQPPIMSREEFFANWQQTLNRMASEEG